MLLAHKILLQVTVNNDHGIAAKPFKDLIVDLQTHKWIKSAEEIQFIFVVPKASFTTYKRQNFLTTRRTVETGATNEFSDVKQYVLGIDLQAAVRGQSPNYSATGIDLDELDIEALRRKLATVLLELRNTRLDLTDTKADLMDAMDNLEFTQIERDAALSRLTKTQLELQDTKIALAKSESALREADENRVISRPPGEQEVFAVLRFKKPQPLPVGGFRIFTVQQKSIGGRLKNFVAENPELDAVEVEELRFDNSPRGENVIQYMRRDEHAPIKIFNRSFILKDGEDGKDGKDGKRENDMIEYITKVFNTHTQDSSTPSAT
ncbi:hypothetical protein BGZ46_002861 [Entomortierella lignicola]|nr:hypothetical protein BGZ46_002861 [Entomortierella lignicola]